MRPAAQVAALVLEPFALWLAEREHGDGLPLAVTDAGRVLHANTLAQSGSVQTGMPIQGALSRLPMLHTVPLSAPALEAGWAEVASTLPAYSPRVEGLNVGRALLTLTPLAAAELARALHGQVGLAQTCELALLAALSAQPGQVQAVGSEKEFRQALPLNVLRGVGLSAEMLERLRWLGLQQVGDLLKWSQAQQAAYLGAEFRTLRPYLHGCHSGGVQAARLPSEVSARLDFNEPLYEPGEVEAAAADLVPLLQGALKERAPQQITVRAGVAGVTLRATRPLKEHLRDSRALHRAILRTLQDADAARYGIETLEVVLGSLTRPAHQEDLWNRAAAGEAARLAERRFPGSMQQVQWLDPYSLAADTAFRWISARTQTPVPSPVRAVRRPGLAPVSA